jgi:hypothetical protein
MLVNTEAILHGRHLDSGLGFSLGEKWEDC